MSNKDVKDFRFITREADKRQEILDDVGIVEKQVRRLRSPYITNNSRVTQAMAAKRNLTKIINTLGGIVDE